MTQVPEFVQSARSMEVVHAAGSPEVGNLATPINSSAFTRAFINNLPAYRTGLSPQRRGLEVGMAHGYLLYGPFVLLGPLRDTDVSGFAGAAAAILLVLVLTVCLSLYSSNGVKKPVSTLTNPNPPEALSTVEGWSEFAGGFLIGGIGGVIFAYLLVQVLDAGVFDIIGMG
ncbi:MAG: photosystem I reaction center subunit XI [Elainellaceae cyanobacterium]